MEASSMGWERDGLEPNEGAVGVLPLGQPE